jgi:hypothetical protein
LSARAADLDDDLRCLNFGRVHAEYPLMAQAHCVYRLIGTRLRATAAKCRMSCIRRVTWSSPPIFPALERVATLHYGVRLPPTTLVPIRGASPFPETLLEIEVTAHARRRITQESSMEKRRVVLPDIEQFYAASLHRDIPEYQPIRIAHAIVTKGGNTLRMSGYPGDRPRRHHRQGRHARVRRCRRSATCKRTVEAGGGTWDDYRSHDLLLHRPREMASRGDPGASRCFSGSIRAAASCHALPPSGFHRSCMLIC